LGSASGVDGIDFLLSKLGEFFPDLDKGGAERFPFPLALLPLALPPELLLELNDGETDLEDPDLLVRDAEMEDGMLRGFNFTVGVFLKLLLCRSVDFWPLTLPLCDRAGDVLAEEGAEREPEPDEPLPDNDEMLGEAERPPDGEYEGKEFLPLC